MAEPGTHYWGRRIQERRESSCMGRCDILSVAAVIGPKLSEPGEPDPTVAPCSSGPRFLFCRLNRRHPRSDSGEVDE